MTSSTNPKRSMRAAVIDGPRSVQVKEVPLPSPAPDQVRVRVEGCGVCHSNLPPWEGRPWFEYPLRPGALGHEGFGVVESVGAKVTRLQVGDRVAFLSDHAYAEYDVAHEGSALRLPAALADQPFPAEPMGCAMNIARRADLRPGQQVAIVGVGFLGVLLTRLATHLGARVVAVARRPFARELALAHGAVAAVPFGDKAQVLEALKAATGGALCERVIEVVGEQATLDLATELTAERGTLVVAGYHQDGPRQVNLWLWNWRGLDVVNAHEREPRAYLEGMARAVEAVQAGVLSPRPLLTHRFALEQLGDALDALRERPAGFLKGWVAP